MDMPHMEEVALALQPPPPPPPPRAAPEEPPLPKSDEPPSSGWAKVRSKFMGVALFDSMLQDRRAKEERERLADAYARVRQQDRSMPKLSLRVQVEWIVRWMLKNTRRCATPHATPRSSDGAAHAC